MLSVYFSSFFFSFLSLAIKQAVYFPAVMLLCLHIFLCIKGWIQLFNIARGLTRLCFFFFFFSMDKTGAGWMNELNEFTVEYYCGVIGSLGRRNKDHLFVHIGGEDL